MKLETLLYFLENHKYIDSNEVDTLFRNLYYNDDTYNHPLKDLYKLYIKDLSEDEVEDLWLFNLTRLEAKISKQYEKAIETSILKDNKLTLVDKELKSKHLEFLFKNTNKVELLDAIDILINHILTSYQVKRYLGNSRRGIFIVKGKNNDSYRSLTNNISLSKDNWNYTDLYGEATRNLNFEKDYSIEASNSIKSYYDNYILIIMRYGKIKDELKGGVIDKGYFYI